MSADASSLRRDDLRTLGLVPTAGGPEIMDAYLRLRRALRADSAALRSAASDEERRDMLRRVEEAYLRLAAQAGQPANAGGPWRVLAGAPAPERPGTESSTAAWAAPGARRGAQGGAAPGTPGPERRWLEPGLDEGAPPLDVRSRPSPFRRRPSLPLA